jgi:predicted ATPase/DNA-binding CsgD family transcriptional regulator
VATRASRAGRSEPGAAGGGEDQSGPGRRTAYAPGAGGRPLAAAPSPASAFVGRERELAAVRERLCREDVRLVTLTGPGGAGKTRLALEAAARAAGFTDGIVFVPLAGIDPSGQVLPAVATALGLRAAGGRPPRGRRRRVVRAVRLTRFRRARSRRTGSWRADFRRTRRTRRPAGGPPGAALSAHLGAKRLLLILDGFEHLRPAAPEVGRLLTACPRLTVLATSRARLRLSGEHEIPVRPLPLPDAADVAALLGAGPDGAPAALARLSRNESVRLFVARARAAGAGFALDGATAGAVGAICRRLDGLPLAIELAAARTRLCPPAGLLARLRRRLPLLEGGPQDAPARQQSLRRTIAWSYDRLDAPRRSLLRRLSVFRAAFTLEAAVAVAGEGAGGVLDLEALLDENLVLRAAEVAGEPRLELLETVREFARERLHAAGEATAARRRHAEYCLALAEAAAPALEGAARDAWLARLAAVHDDVRAALRWLSGHGDGERALRLGVALWPFWRLRGHREEARDWLLRLLARAGDAGDAGLRAAALVCAGDLAWLGSDFDGARALLEESVALHLRDEPPGRRAAALFRLGILARTQGDLTRARAAAEESLTLARAVADPERIAWALGLLASVIALQGELETAGALLAETVARYQELGDSGGLAWARFAQGQIALQAEDGPLAAGPFAAALAAFRDAGDASGTAAALHGLGNAARLQGDLARARRLLRQSAARFERLGERHNAAPALAALGRVAHLLGEPAVARVHYRQALILARPLGAAPAAAPALEGLAALEAAEGRSDLAARLLGAAEAIRPQTERTMPTAVLGQRERAAVADRLRVRLGPATLAAALRRGRELPLDAAIGGALDALPATPATAPLPSRRRPRVAPTLGPDSAPGVPASPASSTRAAAPGDLSPREREVAALIAHGLTNRQLAARLFITPGTAANHVVHILNKLGLSTRVQIAAWAVGQGLIRPAPVAPAPAPAA